MSEEIELTIVPAGELSKQLRSQIAQLTELCCQSENIEGMLHLDLAEPGQVNQILAYAGGRLAGIVTLSSGDEIELLGMVAPAYRRRGIGRTLLAAARQECVQRDVTQFLLVVEEASPAGVAFAEVMSGRYQFSEHLMELDPALTQQSAPKSAKPEGRLIVKEVGQAAEEQLIMLRQANSNNSLEYCQRQIRGWLADPAQRFYLGRLGAQAVGMIRVAPEGDAVYLSSFSVLPEVQGRGYGRQILWTVAQWMLAEGKTVRLEVETKNDNALGLYHSCGFRTLTTFRYVELSV